MPKADPLAAHLNDDSIAEAVAVTRQSKSDARSRVILFFVVIQTMILLAICGFGVHAYSQVMSKAQQLEQFSFIVNNPQVLLSHPALPGALAGLLQDTSSAFFFGASNGTISTFLQDLFQTNFAGTASNLEPLFSTVFQALQQRQTEPQCTQLVQCSNYGDIQCPNGNWVYCEPDSVVNCASCPYGGPMSAFSLFTSVASKIALLPAVAPVNPVAAPAAFSNGLLRVNSLLTWLGSQGNIEEWTVAASQCEVLANSVAMLDWSANYTGEHGESKSWDANSQIHSVVKQFQRYCPIIANLPLLVRNATKNN